MSQRTAQLICVLIVAAPLPYPPPPTCTRTHKLNQAFPFIITQHGNSVGLNYAASCSGPATVSHAVALAHVDNGGRRTTGIAIQRNITIVYSSPTMLLVGCDIYRCSHNICVLWVFCPYGPSKTETVESSMQMVAGTVEELATARDRQWIAMQVSPALARSTACAFLQAHSPLARVHGR